MNYKPIILFFLLFTLLSCEQIFENYLDQRERDNYISPYAGTYLGTYSGNGDSGSLKIVVDSKDLVSATRYSTVFKMEEILYGGMVGPSLYKVNSPNSGFKITGNLTSQTNTYKGTWSQSGLSGEWTVTKK